MVIFKKEKLIKGNTDNPIKKINYSPPFKVSNYYENDYELFDFMKHFNHR